MNRVWHLHIPKCSGGTILALLTAQYGSNNVLALPARYGWRTLEPEDIAGKAVVSGHFAYGLHARLEDPDPVYFTILRHPLERAASLYAYIKMRGRGHAGYKHVRDATPQEFAEAGPFDNCQTRMLAGREDFGWYEDKARVDGDDLWRARHNLTQMAYVGDVSTLKADVATLTKLFGWRVMALPHVNASFSKPRIEPTTAFKTKWAMDLALYEWFTEYREVWYRRAEDWHGRFS